MKLINIVWEEDKYFVAQCVNVDVSSFGITRQEALNNLQEALDLYFENEKNTNIININNIEIVESNIQYA